MSEFSAGVLLKKDNETTVKRILKKEIIAGDYFLYPVNDTWYGLFPKDIFLMSEESVKVLKKLSKDIPVFYFLNCEDHDWGYKVFIDGNIKASCLLPTYMKNRESCISVGGPFLDEAHLLVFREFDIDEKDLKVLEKMMTLEYVSQQNSTEKMREKFMEILNIKEFVFMSYSYLIDEIIDEIE